MNTIRVMSKNAAYQKFEVLRTNRNKRYRYGEFLVEGVRNINQAVRNGWQFTGLLYSPETPRQKVKQVQQKLREGISNRGICGDGR